MKPILEKTRALFLRKKGKSYQEIASILKISKSTVSVWLKDLNWSQSIKQQLIKKSKIDSRKRMIRLSVVQKEKLAEHYIKAEKEATKEFAK